MTVLDPGQGLRLGQAMLPWKPGRTGKSGAW